MSSLQKWWRKFRKLDCPECKSALGRSDGYCKSCNKFPHRKWITDAEDMFISDIALMRDNPEEYEKHERELSKLSLRHSLKGKTEKRLLIAIYGEGFVSEVEQELKYEALEHALGLMSAEIHKKGDDDFEKKLKEGMGMLLFGFDVYDAADIAAIAYYNFEDLFIEAYEEKCKEINGRVPE